MYLRKFEIDVDRNENDCENKNKVPFFMLFVFDTIGNKLV